MRSSLRSGIWPYFMSEVLEKEDQSELKSITMMHLIILLFQQIPSIFLPLASAALINPL